jgi:hypothetical protein
MKTSGSISGGAGVGGSVEAAAKKISQRRNGVAWREMAKWREKRQYGENMAKNDNGAASGGVTSSASAAKISAAGIERKWHGRKISRRQRQWRIWLQLAAENRKWRRNESAIENGGNNGGCRKRRGVCVAAMGGSWRRWRMAIMAKYLACAMAGYSSMRGGIGISAQLALMASSLAA